MNSKQNMEWMTQYRLWAEMFLAGVHKDKDEPPHVPMFGSQRKRSMSSNSGTDLSNALTNVAVAITNALRPDSQRGSPAQSPAFSPSEAVDMCTKYIQQLKDLLSLHEMGGLTNEEYEEERATVVRQMRKLPRDE